MGLASACERFFAVPELLSLPLHQADTTTLIHCQRVCRTWSDIIKQSKILQENLYLKAQDSSTGATTQFEPVILNPVASAYFTALLTTSGIELPKSGSALQSQFYTYAELASLPWARDGTNIDAPTRLAFARSETSWREMLITQPPIHQFDWWHTWDTDKCTERRVDSYNTLSGDGHGRNYDKPITLGMLWDIVEARLFRGCSGQLTLFLCGCPTTDDPTASALEQRWATFPGRRGFVATEPRIRLVTHHEWTVEPSMYQHFDVQQRCWNVLDELPFTLTTDDEQRRYDEWDGNGFVWLNEDCKRDSEEGSRRWSRSENCDDSSLSVRVKGGGQRSHADSARRRERNEEIRARMQNR